jgi:hypothetical protein
MYRVIVSLFWGLEAYSCLLLLEGSPFWELQTFVIDVHLFLGCIFHYLAHCTFSDVSLKLEYLLKEESLSVIFAGKNNPTQ